MMKQGKNKKGRLAKSTLSVVLAASMVMTSSSFVWASPVDVQEIQTLEMDQVGVSDNTVDIEEPVTWGDNLTVTPEVVSGYLNTDKTMTYAWYMGSVPLKGEAATLASTVDMIGQNIYCTVTGVPKGSNEGETTVDVRFQVVAKEITDLKVAFEGGTGDGDNEFEYNGTPIQPVIAEVSSDTYGDLKLTEDDYMVEWPENLTDAGEKTITVTLNDTDTTKGYVLTEVEGAEKATAEYIINPLDLADYSADVSELTDDLMYSGDVQSPVKGDLDIYKGEVGEEVPFTLSEDLYEVKYEANEDQEAKPSDDKAGVITAGDYKLTISAKTMGDGSVQNIEANSSIGAVTGDEFSVAKKTGSSFKLKEGEEINMLHTGKAITLNDLETAVKDKVVDKEGKAVADGEYELAYKADDSEGKSTINVGAGKEVIFKSKGINYDDSTSGTLTFNVINGKVDVEKSEVEGAADGLEYTSEAITPDILLKDEKGNPIQAKKDVDYKLTYTGNTDVTKEATVTVSFLDTGALKGTESFTKKFEIKPMAVTDDKNIVTIATPSENQKFTFDGTEKSPVVTSVKYKITGKTIDMVAGKDYKVIDNKATNAGEYEATVIAIGNYGNGSDKTAGDGNVLGKVKYTIERAAFDASTVKAVADPIGYTGEVQKATFKVTNLDTGKEVAPREYKVQYLDSKGEVTTAIPTDKGSYKAKIVYTGYTEDRETVANYKVGDSITADFTIGSSTLDNALIVLSKDTFVYNPAAGSVPSVVSVNIGAKPLNVGSATGAKNDYLVEYPEAKDCKDVGTYTIKIIGQNDYEGQVREVTFQITAKEIAELADFEVKAGTTHAGTTGTPYAVIKDGDYTLIAGTDYEMVNDTTGKKVTITGIGNYKTAAAITKNYTVATSMALADPSIQVEVKGAYSYDGKQKRPSIDDITLTEVYEGGSFVLRKGTDYLESIAYGDNIKAGKGTVTLTGNGSYTGTRVVEFDIAGIDITTEHKIDTAKLDALSLTYAKDKDHAENILSAVSVVNTKTQKTLTKGENGDYTVTLLQDGKEVTKAINPGVYTVKVEGTNNYTGTLTYNVTILGISLESVANIPSKLDDQVYTGKEITPEVPVTAKSSTLKLVKDTDYTVSYLNNTESGTAYAVVQGAGIYSGTILVPFSIVGVDLKDAVVTVAEGTYTYNGKAQTPAVTVKLGDAVVDAANYDVSYDENTNAGTATVTVTGKNGYTGTPAAATFTIAKADQKLAVSKTITDALKIRNTNANTYTLKVTGAQTRLSYKSSNTKIATVNTAGKISFKHVCGKATITVTAAADDNYNAATLKVAVAVKPATPSITIAAREKGFNAKATAVRDITGYQVGYSTDKNFAAAKTIKKLVKTTKALNKNFSGLSAKKGYYVRVRAYKIASDGTVYWGNWTGAKKITTK